MDEVEKKNESHLYSDTPAAHVHDMYANNEPISDNQFVIVPFY